MCIFLASSQWLLTKTVLWKSDHIKLLFWSRGCFKQENCLKIEYRLDFPRSGHVGNCFEMSQPPARTAILIKCPRSSSVICGVITLLSVLGRSPAARRILIRMPFLLVNDKKSHVFLVIFCIADDTKIVLCFVRQNYRASGRKGRSNDWRGACISIR